MDRLPRRLGSDPKPIVIEIVIGFWRSGFGTVATVAPAGGLSCFD